MQKLTFLAVLFSLLILAKQASAATIESDSGGTVFATYLVTIAPDGTVSTVQTGRGPYDGSDDDGFDVINESPTPVFALNLSSQAGDDMFGFDTDGISTFIATGNTADSSGYAGPGANVFSDIVLGDPNTGGSLDTGVINFVPAIPAGTVDAPGSNYFSLESDGASEPFYTLLSVSNGSVPEPTSAAMAIMLSVVALRRRGLR